MNMPKMVCPHCKMPIDIDEIYMAQKNREFEERNKEVLQEAIRRQEEENKKKMEEAIASARSEQDNQISNLLVQIKELTAMNQKANEELQKMLKKEVDLKQQLNTVETEA